MKSLILIYRQYTLSVLLWTALTLQDAVQLAAVPTWGKHSKLAETEGDGEQKVDYQKQNKKRGWWAGRNKAAQHSTAAQLSCSRWAIKHVFQYTYPQSHKKQWKKMYTLMAANSSRRSLYEGIKTMLICFAQNAKMLFS